MEVKKPKIVTIRAKNNRVKTALCTIGKASVKRIPKIYPRHINSKGARKDWDLGSIFAILNNV